MIIFRKKKDTIQPDIERRIAKTQTSERLMAKVAGDLKDSTEENFKQQGRQPRWKRLKQSTLLRRAKQGKTGRILQVTGQLASSVTTRYGKLKAVIGSNLVYARIHQMGGFAGINRSTKIPARPYMKLTKQEEKQIGERIGKYFA